MSSPNDSDAPWQRLDPRMLLVDPLRTLGRLAVPAVIAMIGLGSSDSGLSLVAMPAVLGGILIIGLLPWLTTRYRVTATQLQVRRGLLQRTMLTAPLDRIRSVDLEASPLRRILSVTQVQIGTGVDGARILLDSLSVDQARELRSFLLAHGERPGVEAPEAHPEAHGEQGQPDDSTELARIDWAWLRFAPFSLARLVIVAGALGAVAQFGEPLPFLDSKALESARDWVLDQPLAPVLILGTLGVLLGWVLISVGGYVLQWWDLRLTRSHGNLQLTAGLFTTRSTSVEERRVRGVELVEPALLRLVGGGELRALATGVGSGGVAKLLPPSPRRVAQRVGDNVLETSEPLAINLVRHGPKARRRCHVALQLRTGGVTIVALVAALAFAWSLWLPVIVLLVLAPVGAVAAELTYRHLGHELTAAHLVSGSGALERRRTVLERDGIIGWVVVQSWFQRRLGLATLVATTAAGSERVVVRDVPLTRAIALADAATPGLLAPFLRPA